MKYLNEYTDTCPVCKRKTLKSINYEKNLPYFGRTQYLTVWCTACKYRHVEYTFLEPKKPTKAVLKISGPEDLNIRVVRSSKGTIKVPELGIEIAPVTMGEPMITNVEGIFTRIIKIIAQLYKDADLDHKRALTKLLKTIGHVRVGKATLTLIIEDPLGLSQIVSDKAKITKLE